MNKTLNFTDFIKKLPYILLSRRCPMIKNSWTLISDALELLLAGNGSSTAGVYGKDASGRK
jgi:hypothetical protein